MHILISNDDGIFAPGILALAKAAKAAGHRVTIFAPDSQRSAASHGLSITKPVSCKAVEYDDGIPAYAVSGTPADCVRLGLYLTREDPVDCVLSGVNNGANRGAAILYSGTVAAAMEASLCAVPGVAVSLCSYKNEGFDEAARLGVMTAEWAMEYPLPRGEIYNLNVPKRETVLGIKPAVVSYEFIVPAMYNQLEDGSYLLSDEDAPTLQSPEDSDLVITRSGYASLSVLTWNMLASTPMPDLSKLNEEYISK